MNRYAQAIIREFSAVKNREVIYKGILAFFADTPAMQVAAGRYLKDNFIAATQHFVKSMEQLIAYSEPMPGLTIQDQVNCFNKQFISDRVQFIRSHVLRIDDEVPIYSLTDGMPAQSRSNYQVAPDDILDSWRINAGRQIQARDDTQGKNAFLGGVSSCDVGGVIPDKSQRCTERDRMPASTRYFQHMPGITICDQSLVGLNQHATAYENTMYKKLLNPTIDTAFGVSSPTADAKLMATRTRGEVGIPKYERWLYSRPYDRDIVENLPGEERDFQVRGFDMGPLLCRVNNKRTMAARSDPVGCADKMQLWNQRPGV